jgi:hypothetical protein
VSVTVSGGELSALEILGSGGATGKFGSPGLAGTVEPIGGGDGSFCPDVIGGKGL